MFEGSDFPKSLDEDHFEAWLEKGRESKIGYKYLLIVWNAFESDYVPVYVESREGFESFDQYGESSSNETLLAVYDLYSESRIALR